MGIVETKRTDTSWAKLGWGERRVVHPGFYLNLTTTMAKKNTCTVKKWLNNSAIDKLNESIMMN